MLLHSGVAAQVGSVSTRNNNAPQPVPTPTQLTVVKEYKDAFPLDLSGDGKLLLLSTYVDMKNRNPLGDGYYSVVEFESGLEIDRFNWTNGRGHKKFLSNSYQILSRRNLTNLDKIEFSILDPLRKTSGECVIGNDDFKGVFIYPFDSQKALATFDRSTSLPPDKLFLLTFPDCSLKQIGQVSRGDAGAATDTVHGIEPFSSRNKRFFALKVNTYRGNTSEDIRIGIWDIETNKVIKQLHEIFPYLGGGYTPDGRFFYMYGRVREKFDQGKKGNKASEDEDYKWVLQLYDTDKYELVVQREFPYESGSLAFSADGKYLAFIYNNVVKKLLSSYVEPTVELYETNTWNKVAVGAYPRYPYIWDKTFPSIGGFVRFTPDSKYLITDLDYTRIWRVP